MVNVRLTWCTASNRSPEEHCSTPVPHHAAGGRLSLGGPLPGEQGSTPINGPGRGWTLQVSGLETLEKARQHIQYHPSGAGGKWPWLSKRAALGKVLTPRRHTSHGRSGYGFNHLLNQSVGQGFRALGWVTGCGRRAETPRLTALPSQALRGEETQSSRSRPGRTGITPPGFYGSGNLGKAGQRIQYPARSSPAQGFGRSTARIACINPASITHQSGKNQAGKKEARLHRFPSRHRHRTGSSRPPAFPCISWHIGSHLASFITAFAGATQRPAAALNHSTLRYDSRCHHQPPQGSRPRPLAQTRPPALPWELHRNPQPLRTAAHASTHQGYVGQPANPGQRQHPDHDATGPASTHSSPGVQNALFQRGRCIAATVSTSAAMYLSNRGCIRRPEPGLTQTACNNRAETGEIPPSQLRITPCPPMPSKSRFLYTSMTFSRNRKISRPERGACAPPHASCR